VLDAFSPLRKSAPPCSAVCVTAFSARGRGVRGIDSSLAFAVSSPEPQQDAAAELACWVERADGRSGRHEAANQTCTTAGLATAHRSAPVDRPHLEESKPAARSIRGDAGGWASADNRSARGFCQRGSAMGAQRARPIARAVSAQRRHGCARCESRHAGNPPQQAGWRADAAPRMRRGRATRGMGATGGRHQTVDRAAAAGPGLDIFTEISNAYDGSQARCASPHSSMSG
jgi:hypothetical protein